MSLTVDGCSAKRCFGLNSSFAPGLRLQFFYAFCPLLIITCIYMQAAKISTFFKNGKPKEAAVVQLLGMNGVTIEMLLALLFASTFYIFCTCTFILLGMHVFTAGGESIADVTSGVSTILIGGSILWANKQAKKEVSDTGDNLQTTKLISNCISTFKAMLDRQTPTASLSDPAAHVFCIAEAPASGEAPKEKTRAHRRARKVSPV